MGQPAVLMLALLWDAWPVAIAAMALGAACTEASAQARLRGQARRHAQQAAAAQAAQLQLQGRHKQLETQLAQRETTRGANDLAPQAPGAAAQATAAAVGSDGLAVRLTHPVAQADELPTSLGQLEGAFGQALIDHETLRETIAQVARAFGQLDGQLAEATPWVAEATNLGGEVADDLAALGGMSANARLRGLALRQDWQGAGEVLARWAEALLEMQRSVVAVQDAAAKAKLLSLNAAIVASQAGEHGRGFSVVAEQIKSLAQRTATAAQGMGQWLGRIEGYKGQLAAISEQHGAVLKDADGDNARIEQRAQRAVAAVAALRALLAQHEPSSHTTAVGAKAPATPMHGAVAKLIDELLHCNAAIRAQANTTRHALLQAAKIQAQARELRSLSPRS